ncbi:MAG: cupin domain-containing protein [Planctomycetes bacterium]|nr:cupin domain-containing protein [Planctomycetota bacterium]
MKATLFALLIAVSLATTAPQDARNPEPQGAPRETVVVSAANVKWGPHPFVEGAKMAVQSGDPSKGPSVLLMKFPKGMTIPAHWHTATETVTLVSGTALLGSGETVDATKGTEIGAGSFAVIPGKNRHWAIAKEEFVISVALDKAADFTPCGEKK